MVSHTTGGGEGILENVQAVHVAGLGLAPCCEFLVVDQGRGMVLKQVGLEVHDDPGLFQIKPETAAEPYVDIPEVKGHENVKKNIHAGIKYLAFLRDRYFSDPQFTANNQLAFSWAAYNAGPANVRKMRNKAKKMGLDPNVWFGNVELAAAKTVGREPVQYVRNIFKYYVAYALVREKLLGPTES